MMKTITHTQRWKDYVTHYIMEENGSGMVRVTAYEDHTFEISDLYVDEKCRNGGIATQLMKEAISVCKQYCFHGKITIAVNYNSDTWVSKWYKNLGFRFDKSHLEGSNEWYNIYKIDF